ncbi:hypothetical protein FZEAL_7176 [Fusarium zealandicum]|uniref:Uncharacterized protein n=1 Tax=Fusarium zealandicum TaxID=1053134 RepID=A0A8H4UGB4_9HYPO|nr:hypothetical protein FZEAL_7176 [Fusarium zealandicum]
MPSLYSAWIPDFLPSPAFTPTDTALVEEAIATIEHDLGRSTGLTEREFHLLTFYINNSYNQQANLTSFATSIIHGRAQEAFSQADKDLIHCAAQQLYDHLSAQGKTCDDAAADEKRVIWADDRLNHGETDTQFSLKTTNRGPAESVLSRSSSMLAALESLTVIPNLRERNLSDLNSSEAARVTSSMRAHADRFSQGGAWTVASERGLQDPRFPVLPMYAECRLEDLPDAAADIDAEIEARLWHQAEASEFMVRNSGLLWRLKMKRNVLRLDD